MFKIIILLSLIFSPQVLYEKGKISEKTQNILNNTLVSALKEALKSGSQFWDSSKTLKFLSENQYFEDETDKSIRLPGVLKDMIADGGLNLGKAKTIF